MHPFLWVWALGLFLATSHNPEEVFIKIFFHFLCFLAAPSLEFAFLADLTAVVEQQLRIAHWGGRKG